MFYAALLSISFVVFVIAWLVYLAGVSLPSRIQAIHKELTSLSTSRPKTLSALGDQLDAMQIHLRSVDTKLDTVQSLARSNRTRITNLQHRGEGSEEGAEETPPPNPAAVVRRLPGRTN